MRRYFRHILLSLISVICTVSCIKELDDPNPIQVSDAPTVLVPRVKSFTNQYITKAGYTTDETQISSLTVLVFNNNGQLVHIQQPSNLSSIELNKSMLDAPDQDVTAATIVMIANVGLDKITDGNGKTFQEIKANKLALTLEGMENCTFDFSANPVITSISDNFTGFPMIGGVKNVNLSATKESQNAISVPLKILYAKVKFEINIENGGENEGPGVEFDLTKYSVNNVSWATTVAIPTEKDQPVLDFLGNPKMENDTGVNATETQATISTEYITEAFEENVSGSATLNGTSVEFTFYIAENRYNHNLSDSDFSAIYPWSDWSQEYYKDYLQQYKPKVAEESASKSSNKPTYVILNGSYTDYRGTIWTVNYKIYLGKDNYQNFHVDRNSQYTNIITIKGIRNNGPGTKEEVWVDHRVTAESGTMADNIKITRETLIDCHYEVRPLRIQYDEEVYAYVYMYLPEYDGAQIVEDPNTSGNENWIAIENNNGRISDKSKYCENGKRRYFTTSLIDELHKGNEYDPYSIQVQQVENKVSGGQKQYKGYRYIPLKDDDCVWIYFDENSPKYNSSTGGVTNSVERSATIDIVFYDSDYEIKDVQTYKLTQKPMSSVTSDGKTYYFEEYEEYLHSYDSEDKYSLVTSPTDYTQRGLPWDKEIRSYSGNYIVSAAPLQNGNTDLTDQVDYRYDYYHKKDQPSNDTYYEYLYDENSKKWINQTPHGTGINFTDRGAARYNTTVMSMGDVPESAYQYCLSKNKFKEDANGNHTLDIHWYLPDVYELQAILGSGAGSDFSNDAYWSSQPSRKLSNLAQWLVDLVNGILGLLGRDPLTNVGAYEEVTASSRAVARDDNTTQIVDVDRSAPSRIRCLYSAAGRQADMSDRVPDGVGGLRRYSLKVYPDYPNTTEGYFYPKKPEDGSSSKDEIKYGSGYKNGVEVYYPYPKNASNLNSNGVVAGFTKNINPVYDDSGNFKGFDAIPTMTSLWVNDDTYGATTLGQHWPGLSPNKIDTTNISYIIGSYDRYTETSQAKEKKRIKYKHNTTEIPIYQLSSIDLDEQISMSFAFGTNSSSAPTFQYFKVESSDDTTYVSNWEAPVYAEGKIVKAEQSGSKTNDPGSVEWSSADNDWFTKFINNDQAARTKIANEVTVVNVAKDITNVTKINSTSVYRYVSSTAATAAGDLWYQSTYGNNSSYEKVDVIPLESPVDLFTCTYKAYRLQSLGFTQIEVPLGNYTYTYSSTKYSFTVLYKIKGSEKIYYYHSGGGQWGAETIQQTTTLDNNDNPIDELRMYAGNSFTITAAEKYAIHSVKVYFSNLKCKPSKTEDAPNSGVFADRLITSYYLRLAPTASYTSSSGADPSGMNYSEAELNTDSGTMMYDIYDNPQSSVTLYMTCYSDITRQRRGGENTYIPEPNSSKYYAPSTSEEFAQSLVIDYIEVTVKPTTK